ncbi:sorbicillinoid biosynthetic cluster transcription factor 2 [Penicillium hispanicum]|uniref:sorbicillinoid biosynthetic cluster transcription factor 2 n=1 Tax=Penicillium hispanicum TaxID=1080232 RepID=UPI002540D7A4|nr:sorbicillinoid biosynthetic cluster transcription factor 2 [Penicillium hispanicum]KAJ5579989.1 sorbicillinoid biosynthetic cluster transcription factor 2 [Penicillium hispanicum]
MRWRSPGLAHLLASPPTSPAHSLELPLISKGETPSALGPTSRLHHLSEHQKQEPNPDPDQSRVHYTAHGRFAGQVATAIDLEAGIVPPAASHRVPFVDAPLFGEIDLPSQSCLLHLSTELPARDRADKLIDIYWQYIDPVESILDRKRFQLRYEALYSVSPACSSLRADFDNEVWLGILNVVFALAVQRLESIPFHKRDEEANGYFQRAWALLPLESILWKPGSLELVQLLMLTNRYLHCTSNQQKTWMTAGLAIRIAQNMCCHLSGPSAKDSSEDKRLKRKVWASCVGLDRCVSWSLAQLQTQNNLVTNLGLPHLHQQDEYHTVAMKLDSCLNEWEHRLPNDWQLQNLAFVTDRTSRAERYLLHLRYVVASVRMFSMIGTNKDVPPSLLHHRIFLYRPMLSRFYSMKLEPQKTPTRTKSLSDRLFRECAGMCVETAQTVTSLITNILEPDTPIGLVPWWYRIYYLHIAGAIFLAAMIGPDLFTESVSRSWQDLLSALRAHEYLSLYVQQCVQTFETLSARILQTRCLNSNGSGSTPPLEDQSGCSFDEMFQDIGFDFDNFLFGTGDAVEWLF